jgi:hypothetical protein
VVDLHHLHLLRRLFSIEIDLAVGEKSFLSVPTGGGIHLDAMAPGLIPAMASTGDRGG